MRAIFIRETGELECWNNGVMRLNRRFVELSREIVPDVQSLSLRSSRSNRLLGTDEDFLAAGQLGGDLPRNTNGNAQVANETADRRQRIVRPAVPTVACNAAR